MCVSRAFLGGRGGYCPPLIRHSLGFGTHERGSRRLSPHPQPLTRQTPWGAEVRPPPFGRGPRAAAGAPLRRRTKGGTKPRSERRLPLAGGHAVVQHTRVAHTGMHMAVVPRGRGSSRGPRAPPSRSNPSPICTGGPAPLECPSPAPPPHGGGFFVLRIKVGVSGVCARSGTACSLILFSELRRWLV